MSTVIEELWICKSRRTADVRERSRLVVRVVIVIVNGWPVSLPHPWRRLLPPLRRCPPTRRTDLCPRRRRASLVRSLPPCRAHQTRFLARCVGRIECRPSLLLGCRLFPLRRWLLALLARGRRLSLVLDLLMLAIQPLKFFSSGPPVEDVAGDVGVIALAGEDDDFEVLESTVSTR